MRGSRCGVWLVEPALAATLALTLAGDALAQERQRRRPPSPRVPDGVSHVVKPGETLEGIAFDYRVSRDRIALANKLISRTDGEYEIKVGDVLWIPMQRDVPSPPPPPPTGTISGTVSGIEEDLPGMPARATVTVVDVATGKKWEVSTDGGDRFQVTGLPLGEYEVTARDSCSTTPPRKYTLSADKKDVTDKLQLSPLKLPVEVRNARSGQGLPGAKITFRRDGPVERTPRLPVIWFKPVVLTTDSDGSSFETICYSPEDSEALLREAGWIKGSGGVYVHVSASDFYDTVQPITPGTGTLGERPWGNLEVNPQVVPLYPMEAVPEDPKILISVDGGVDSLDSVTPSKIEDSAIFLLNGRLEEQTSTTVGNDQYSAMFGNGSSVAGFGPEVSYNQPLGPPPKREAAPGAAGRPAPFAPARRAVLSFTAGIRRSQEELEFDKLDDATPGGRDTTWKATGMVARAGVGQSFRFGRTLLLRFGYRHERLLETDATRSPGLQPSGGRLLRDEGRLSRRKHVVRANVAWSGRHVSPWAGLRLSREAVRLEGEAAAEFDVRQGLLEQRITFVNEFVANTVLADFGVDVRIPRSKVLLRAQGATNGSNFRLQLGAAYGMFRRR